MMRAALLLLCIAAPVFGQETIQGTDEIFRVGRAVAT